jgi:hypothetical protein
MLPENDNNTMKKFVIFAAGRSGSTMLTSRLGSHPDLHVQGEILNLGFEHRLTTSQRVRLKVVERFGFTRANLDLQFNGSNFGKVVENLVWGRPYRSCNAAGFKIIIDQWLRLPNHEQEAFLHKHELKIILIRRRDTLSHLVSTKQAHLHGYRHRRVGQPTIEFPPVDLDLNDLKAFHTNIFVMTSFIASFFSKYPIIETTYEDLVNEPDRENKRLLEFLGVRDVPLLEVMARNSNNDLSRRIAGFEEFAQSLRGTAYEHLLPDDDTAKA